MPAPVPPPTPAPAASATTVCDLVRACRRAREDGAGEDADSGCQAHVRSGEATGCGDDERRAARAPRAPHDTGWSARRDQRKSQGKTPLTVQNLPFGILMVRLEYPGYQSLQRRVVLNATRPAETLDLPGACAGCRGAPAPAASKSTGFHGGVLFESRPAGAKVFIDNAQVGVTPLSMPSVRAGSHAVRFELNGFRRWTASVRVVAGERTRVAASLEEETPR